MITNTGKSILGKYLVGQTSAYATHISLGCGAHPLDTGELFTNQNTYAFQEDMEFEMFRVPILSRGYIEEPTIVSTTANVSSVSVDTLSASIINLSSTTNLLKGQVLTATDGTGSLGSGTVTIAGITNTTAITVTSTAPITAGTITDITKTMTKISFTAEMPTTEKYEITEIGVWSAPSNPVAGNGDSRLISSFDVVENWEYHTVDASTIITLDTEPLDTTTNEVFRINASDSVFNNDFRKNAQEKPRYQDSAIMLGGNTAVLTSNVTSGEMETTSGSHIHLTNFKTPFDTNTSEDELRIAFSIIKKNTETYEDPTDVKILVQFATEESGSVSSEYANMQIHLESADIGAIDGSQYYVVTKKLGELYRTTGFSWSSVKLAKIFVDITPPAGRLATDYFVCFDALRFENKTALSLNPLYGMVGYTVIRNAGNQPISKNKNSDNLVEFRFALDLGVSS